MSDRALRVARAIWPVVALSLPLLLLSYVGASGSALLEREITTGLVNVVLVVGLYIFVGNSGVISFGQMAFAAIGAYAAALLTIPPEQKAIQLPDLPGFLADVHMGFLLAAVVAGLFVAVIALIVAVAFMRLNGIAAGIATFAGLIVVRTVLSNWESVTRGEQQMIVPLSTNLDNAVVVAIGAVAVAYAYQQSAWGLRLRASRENLAAASALGVAISRQRTIAFAISAFFVAIGGALYGHLLGAFSPDAFYLDLTFLIFTMLVVGGINSLTGAVLGTVVVSFVSVVLTRAEQTIEIAGISITAPTGLRDIALGLVLLGIILLRPAGLTGGNEVRWPSRWGGPPRRPRPSAVPPVPQTKESDVAA